ncbi:MAG TPA: ABC transporter [Candidatus Omnitrophica bacterium]|nr:MAG: hypothetical protein A2Z92_02485 [Omnitrophica WOR_2 bacterium GWA2_63_20]OGX18974.1 MAG: hypothetical protein A2105_00950 [Omnitrophica WOR_2 bacterium GWF2_63_9]OGX31870.1 MAG: hypothetical protein A3E56_02455 [Omnitrophica WOR_2 bacterium RIFCSPHIGHO2_12_FULL_64_13]OGX36878.1 MAG: hypothetical protein A3B73_03620 [Omnitrophica WOR_2 bacterium RIFCSPHIGHO2_02_FULL_63_39]OGX44510.1 MAG: hypothetical protein A3I71_02720 [Omnitrophica WOR_2 bacterium RIFCSPLOWO2_02_FULL_63_16]OGX50117.1
MSAAIEVSNLTKRYGAVTALNRISFQVERGEIMGFLGPNGAGKTTTLRILTGLIEPTEGLVRVEGMDVTNHPVEVRRRIGYLPENVSLYPELRVEEYLSYRAAIKGVPRSQRRPRLEEVVQRCALGDVRRRIIGRLSKGYRQRVGLADCLIGQPSILILDEPTVGLDPHQIRQTRELIKDVGRQTTVLLSTHILPEVEMICDRVAIIDHGAIVAVDSPENLRRAMTGTQVVHVELRGDSQAIEQAVAQVRSIPGVQAEIRIPLEEVFIRLTTKDTE